MEKFSLRSPLLLMSMTIALLAMIILLVVAASPPFSSFVRQRADSGLQENPDPGAEMAACPVTQPAAATFVPPLPWPAQPPDPGRFWFGNGRLWTALPTSGSWAQLALGEKFWWWSDAFDVAEDETPGLIVRARRLDGDAPSFETTKATNGYHPSFNWAMLTGVQVASPGCWEFTGEYKEQQLSFVLWVPNHSQVPVDDALADSSQPYTFYLFDPFARNGLMMPLDPQTLADLPANKQLERGLFSADGSTAVNMELPGSVANSDPAESWLVVYDLQSGSEQNRFHPPLKGIIFGLSEDGRRLLFQPDTFYSSRYPPPVEWFVLDTRSGQQVAHVKDDNNACFRQRAYFDPAGQRIYCIVDPALTPVDEPEPMQIAAYDSESGLKIAEQELPEVSIGGNEADVNGQPLREFLEPALVLSPDGQQLAVVHTDADKVTLLETAHLTIERTFSLERSLSLWDFFAPAAAYAKGPMMGTIRRAAYRLDGAYLYVFTQEVLLPPDLEPQASSEPRGLWLVDLEQGFTRAKALDDYQIQWIEAAPDGSVYVFGTSEADLGPYEIRATSPSMLWRLDGLTLEILAERAFPGYRAGRVIVSP